VLKETVLGDFHRKHGGKMVPFAGWNMPVQYEDGILASHKHTRENAALFDVSHMIQLRYVGPDFPLSHHRNGSTHMLLDIVFTEKTASSSLRVSLSPTLPS
jgi:hypothetical protein